MKISVKYIGIILLAVFMLSGCGWGSRSQPRLITQQKIIMPDIPKIRELPRPELTRLRIEKQTCGEEEIELFCGTKQDIIDMKENQIKLQKQIENYEDMVKVYQKFYDAYQKKRASYGQNGNIEIK